MNREEKLFNWDVEDKQLFTLGEGMVGVEVPNYKAIARTDNNKVLGVVKEGYQSVTNKEIEVLCTLIEDAGAKVIGHGDFTEGRKVWIQFDSDLMPRDIISEKARDEVQSKLLLANGHAGALSFSLLSTLVRVVCQNTFNTALRDGDSLFKFKHTASIKEKIKDVEQHIIDVGRATSEVMDVFKKMSDTTLPKKLSVETWFAELLNVKKNKETRIYNSSGKIDTMLNYSTRGENILHKVVSAYDSEPLIKGTNWGLFNAITNYVDHSLQSRSDDSIMFGSGNLLKQKAYSKLTRAFV